MPTNKLDIVIELLKAIEADWAFCDKTDEDDHYFLVNVDREEHPSLKPKKVEVQKLEADGYIQFDEKKSDPKDKKREFMKFLDEYEPVWLIFFYQVTAKGREVIDG